VTPESSRKLDQAQMRGLFKLFERTRRKRLIFGPMLLSALGLVLVGDTSVWRRWILIVVVGLGPLLALARRRFASRRESELVIPPAHLLEGKAHPIAGIFPILAIGALLLATGGIHSPILPFMIPICFLVGNLAPKRVLAGVVLGLLIVLWSVTLISDFGLIPDLMPAIFGGGSGANANRILTYARAVSLTLLLGWVSGVSMVIRIIYRGMVVDAWAARDEALKAHADHTKAMTALSGELAHELKNPLASVKGLAALVAREVDGKAGERLAVLRREVDRMEEILAEFLTFSRPLIPLSQERVDLMELGESAVALHEGLARQFGVELQLIPNRGVLATCDKRKVKQVVMNLLQNAIEASPHGGRVELACSMSIDGGARVEVRDRGPGIPADNRVHIFELGFTTKETGNGLGLAISRAMARQHGGDLVIEDREFGGCVAALTLPPVSAEPERAAS
jgi:signal transduction histidine kinase